MGAARHAGKPATREHSVVVADEDEPTAAALITAAVEVMAERGYHGTSVRDIASAAKVSPASLYHYFGSKHDLLVTIVDRGIDLLVQRTEEALYAAPDDPVSRLNAIVGAHVNTHIVSHRESLLGNSELRSLTAASRALIVSKRDAQQRMFDRVVRDGVRRDVFLTAHPVDASRFVVTACTAVANWYRSSGPLTPEELVERYQRVALDTVGYRGGQG